MCVKDCPNCGGLGYIYSCPNWHDSGKKCCPAGSVNRNCPGVKVPCYVGTTGVETASVRPGLDDNTRF